VDDEARQGALRLAEQEGGPFLAPAETTRIPPLVELPRLLSAAERVLDERESDEDLRLLLAPGSSLGGVRPKASVRDKDGTLAIAKFPYGGDEINIVAWEAVALRLAAKAGLDVPIWRLARVAGRAVLLIRRFDRAGRGIRIPFLSAMSMLGAKDSETHSYLEMADVLTQYGAEANRDMAELWRRIVFTVLISNTDDHLRNHAFLYTGPEGWRLSPAYDLNPVPVDVRPRVLSTSINLDDSTASLEIAFEVAEYFRLSLIRARAIAAEVGTAGARWRVEAQRLGLSAPECDRMSSAFEHEDLKSARKRSQR
jgi:serine/threonine-protein kinase HipA